MSESYNPASLPLAVDLDGTLIHGDATARTLLRFVPLNPHRWPEGYRLWRQDKLAHLKAQMAHCAPDPRSLPYDERVIAWIKDQRKLRRKVVLASASDQGIVKAIADHLKIFDNAFGSDGVINLKREYKAARLMDEFPDGFVYAGNSRDDIAVWEAAKAAVLVNADAALTKIVYERFTVEACFEKQPRWNVLRI